MKFQIKTILILTFSLMLLSACTSSIDEDVSPAVNNGSAMPSYVETDDILKTSVIETDDEDLVVDESGVDISEFGATEDNFLTSSDDQEIDVFEPEAEAEEPIEVPEVEILEERQPDENA